MPPTGQEAARAAKTGGGGKRRQPLADSTQEEAAAATSSSSAAAGASAPGRRRQPRRRRGGGAAAAAAATKKRGRLHDDDDDSNDSNNHDNRSRKRGERAAAVVGGAGGNVDASVDFTSNNTSNKRRKRNGDGAGGISKNNPGKKRSSSSATTAKKKAAPAAAAAVSSSAAAAVVAAARGGFPPCRWTTAAEATAGPGGGGSGGNKRDRLTLEQSKLWMHHFAASATAAGHFPIGVYRLLGTVTRRIDVVSAAAAGGSASASPSAAKATSSKKKPPAPKKKRKPRLPKIPEPSKSGGAERDVHVQGKRITPQRAEKEAAREEEKEEALRRQQQQQQSRNQQQPADGGSRRAKEILQQWNNELKSSGERSIRDGKTKFSWDDKDGHPGGDGTGEGDGPWIRLGALKTWLRAVVRSQENRRSKGGGGDDDDESASAAAAAGAIAAANELLEIVEACQDLHCTKTLWEIPLMQVCIAMKRDDGDDGNSSSSSGGVTVKMAVYGNRMLSEVTTSTLRTVMNALDEGSFNRTIPLAAVPSGPKVFESAPYPVVCVDDDDLDDRRESSGGGGGGGGQTGASENGEDVGGEQKSRDDAKISAFSPTGLLKLLENHGTDVSMYESNIKPKLDGVLRLDLMLHQIHAVCWMVQMESLPGFGLNQLLWEEREFDDGGRYYYSPSLGQMRLDAPHTCRGGLLCDEQGLGKTIEVLSLIVATREELGENAATLIIVPPALVAQWQAEIVKTVGDALTVDYLDYKTGNLRYDYANPDIVLTTYNALDKRASSRFLEEEVWGRIVLDEMQEIRSTTTKIAKTCEKLQSDRRWMLSGTPLFDGIHDFRGELNFLQLEPFAANNEDGFFSFAVGDPWECHAPKAISTLRHLAKVLLRRSKSMTIQATGQPILALQPLTIEFVPVTQTISERALYYFMEWVVSTEMRAATGTTTANAKISRSQCLRLLRDLCTSPMLLNGGMGSSSQMKSLNSLLINQARRRRMVPGAARHSLHQDIGGRVRNPIPVMNCDEAIMHLAALQESTRTNEDEVATMTLGMGQGLARRNRATVYSVDEQIKDAESIVHRARKGLKAAATGRAKARWHWALERITTGCLPSEDLVDVNPKFRSLWLWRSVYIAAEKAMNTQSTNTGSSLTNRMGRLGSAWRNLFGSATTCTGRFPVFLRRGWRLNAVRFSAGPKRFFWTDPNSFFLDPIPKGVKPEDIEHVIASVVDDKRMPFEVKFHHNHPTHDTYCAGLVFKNSDIADVVLRKASTVLGIVVADISAVPDYGEKLKACEAALRDAEAACAVHPTETNKHKIVKARRLLERLQKGLRIVKTPHAGEFLENIIISNAYRHPRSLKPTTSEALIDNLVGTIEDAGTAIAEKSDELSKESEKIERLRKKTKSVPEEVMRLSAFDLLQNLSNGEKDKTFCCICLDTLGSEITANGPAVTMTKCGHLFCKACLDYHASSLGGQDVSCPTCRKSFDPRQDVVLIDPSKQEDSDSEKRKQAKSVVDQAAKMLDESNGHLEPRMWEQLYKSIDVPGDSRRDIKVSAVPGDFLSHLRACTGLPVLSHHSIHPPSDDFISSKLKALLRDIPRGERSVVFTSSKDVIQHLEKVLSVERIGHRSLFSGQAVAECENAVSDWQSSALDEESGQEEIPFPVLIVQSGAAASGLTLTAACKMFLLEPFLRYEQEQQAYARCHRYGQTKPVHCKVYYVPLSVESRLLEWRKQASNPSDNGSQNSFAAAGGAQDARIVYSSIDYVEEDDVVDSSDDDDDDYGTTRQQENESDAGDDNDDPQGSTDQTAYLLGLHNHADDSDDGVDNAL